MTYKIKGRENNICLSAGAEITRDARTGESECVLSCRSYVENPASIGVSVNLGGDELRGQLPEGAQGKKFNVPPEDLRWFDLIRD